MENLKRLGENLFNHPEDPEKLLEESEVMRRVIKTHECYVDLLQIRSRTAKFWLQYQRYVNVLKSFIRTERTGKLSLHLQSMSNMINLLAATGHINCTKCARLHLQNMFQLETKNP